MLLTSFFHLLLAVLAVSAEPMTVRDSRIAAPNGFRSEGSASGDTMLNMRFALTSNNMAGLEEALMDVSTPGRANYRKFLTQEQVDAFVKPTDETLENVNSFLRANGLQSMPLTSAGEWISVSMPVSKANQLFRADFQTFTHLETGKQAPRTLSYSIPTALARDIEGVHPATSFDFGSFASPKFQISQPAQKREVKRDVKGKRALPSSCSTRMTPACLQQLYGIPTTPAKEASNSIAVSAFSQQFASQIDLVLFLQEFRQDLPDTNTFNVVDVDDGTNIQGEPGDEADLDTQYTVGIASNVTVNFFTVGDDNSDGIDGFMDIVAALEKQKPLPTVWTTSYGFNENQIEKSIANTVCNSYMKFGAMGVSVFFSSGDGGVSGSQSQNCTTFQPTFPPSCPFVTAVGATVGFSPEQATGFSSGGFSNYFSQPSYQSTAVETFIKTVPSNIIKLANTTGRAFPDISAQGEHVPIVLGQSIGNVAGTSCSSPIMASITALLNDQLIQKGKAPIGFLNPLLYSSSGSGFTDITLGSNPGCGTIGFNATEGWDAITGWGTPVFSELQALFGI